ncbi:hypothetical protein [Nitrosomonas sp. ANs5]|uniref:hypothetical protein n=1 Tax=Nitrosomonas sp. ANs5 TaxID=3423941 RepID=UPI003D32DE93
MIKQPDGTLAHHKTDDGLLLGACSSFTSLNRQSPFSVSRTVRKRTLVPYAYNLITIMIKPLMNTKAH